MQTTLSASLACFRHPAPVSSVVTMRHVTEASGAIYAYFVRDRAGDRLDNAVASGQASRAVMAYRGLATTSRRGPGVPGFACRASLTKHDLNETSVGTPPAAKCWSVKRCAPERNMKAAS